LSHRREKSLVLADEMTATGQPSAPDLQAVATWRSIQIAPAMNAGNAASRGIQAAASS
jgi:hypothetical protein